MKHSPRICDNMSLESMCCGQSQVRKEWAQMEREQSEIQARQRQKRTSARFVAFLRRKSLEQRMINDHRVKVRVSFEEGDDDSVVVFEYSSSSSSSNDDDDDEDGDKNKM